MKDSPCKNCSERFIACSGKCPKDLRGEYGYKTWLNDVHEHEAKIREWKMQNREDSRRDARYGFVPKKWR